jgi:hypothetical protein
MLTSSLGITTDDSIADKELLGHYLHPHHHPYSSRMSSSMLFSSINSPFPFSMPKKAVEDQETVRPTSTSVLMAKLAADSPCMIQAAARIP